jgi:hypothetical protein
VFGEEQMTLLRDERVNEHAPPTEEPRRLSLWPGRGPVPTSVWLGLTLVIGLVVRLVNLNAFGFSSDEAVYAGQSASLAGNPLFVNQFPVFRAHPLLLQTALLH